MTITLARTVTKDDKILIAAALLNAGVKARLKVIRNGVRVVFQGEWQPVAAVLNNEGYSPAGGGRFGQFNFSQGQVFVRCVTLGK